MNICQIWGPNSSETCNYTQKEHKCSCTTAQKNRSPNLQDSNLQDYVGLFESRVPHEIWWFIKVITVFPIPNLLFGDFRGYAPLLFDIAICLWAMKNTPIPYHYTSY